MEKIVCFGDSNTWGYEPQEYYGGRYGEEDRWPELLGKSLGCTVVNRGLNGRTIPCRPTETQWVLDSLGQDLPCDMLILMLGTNDMMQLNYSGVAGRMEQFLGKLTGLVKPARILLLAPPAIRDDGPQLREEFRLLAENYRALARAYGLHFADAEEWKPSYSWDGIHLSAQGHHSMAEKLREILREM